MITLKVLVSSPRRLADLQGIGGVIGAEFAGDFVAQRSPAAGREVKIGFELAHLPGLQQFMQSRLCFSAGQRGALEEVSGIQRAAGFQHFQQ
jgi:hypothetical protein